jgi:hypothetical protein
MGTCGSRRPQPTLRSDITCPIVGFLQIDESWLNNPAQLSSYQEPNSSNLTEWVCLPNPTYPTTLVNYYSVSEIVNNLKTGPYAIIFDEYGHTPDAIVINTPTGGVNANCTAVSPILMLTYDWSWFDQGQFPYMLNAPENNNFPNAWLNLNTSYTYNGVTYDLLSNQAQNCCGSACGDDDVATKLLGHVVRKHPRRHSKEHFGSSDDTMWLWIVLIIALVIVLFFIWTVRT